MLLPGRVDDDEPSEVRPPAVLGPLHVGLGLQRGFSRQISTASSTTRRLSVGGSFSRSVSMDEPWNDPQGEYMDENTPSWRSNTGWMSVISAISDDSQSELDGSGGAELALSRTEASAGQKPRLNNMRRNSIEGRHLDIHRRPRSMEAATRNFLTSAMAANRFCARLSPQQFDAIIDTMSYYHFEPGSVVVREGEEGYHFFVLQEGVLEITVGGVFTNTLISGNSFGGIALLHNCPRTATVSAKAASGMWAVDGATFRDVIRDCCSKRFAENRRFLDGIGLLDGLTPAQKDRVGELALVEEEFNLGERVVEKGEPSTSIYCVKSGELSIVEEAVLGPDGMLQGGRKVAALAPGDCFGERAALYGESITSTVVAESLSEVICVGIPQLREVLGEDLAQCLQRSLLRSVLRRVPGLPHLSAPQIRKLVDAMVVQTYAPSRAIDEGGMVSIVIDGSAYAKSGMEVISLQRGEFWQDESLLEIDGKQHKPKQPAQQAVERSVLRSGRGGCRIAVLRKQAMLLALHGTGLTCAGASGSSDEQVVDYVRKLLLARKVPAFRELSEDQLNGLVDLLVLKMFCKDDVVCEQGEASGAFFVVSDGEAQVLAAGEPLQVLGKGACFGERALLFDEPRNATVKVTSSSAELWTLSREQFMTVIPKEMREELARRLEELSDSAITLKSLRHVRSIGVGSFGSVRLVCHRRTRVRYALKRVRKKGGAIPKDVRRECELLADIDHPFIVRLVKTLETPTSVYMLTELITGGQLFMYMSKRGALPRRHAQFYVATLILILEHLHDNGIVYRDLKPENIMLDAQGYLKLVDFGLAKKLDPRTMRTFSMVGTLYYLAPELIKGSGYGTSADIWSLGVLFYEMIVGRLPYGDGKKSESDIVLSVLEDTLMFPGKFADHTGKKLIQALLHRRPENRLGIKGWDDVKRNKYFRAGVSGDLFSLIAGRGLPAPVLPSEEVYPPEASLKATLSDADELGAGEDAIIARVVDVFSKVKLDGDRRITRKQLARILRVLDEAKFTNEAVARMWMAMGVKADGRVKLDDFLSWMSLGDGEAFERALALNDVHS